MSQLATIRTAVLAEKHDDVRKLLEAAAKAEGGVASLKLDTPLSAKRFTLLHEAAIKGETAIVKLLLDAGASIDVKDSDGHTPLRMCVQQDDNAGCVKELLARGANPNVVDRHHLAPLLFAAAVGNLEVLKVLLDHEGIDLNLERPDIKSTALQLAAKEGKAAAAEMLTAAGAKIDPLNPLRPGSSGSALFYAAQSNQLALMTTLLEAGANVNIRAAAHSGYTALLMASYNGHDLAVKALLGVEGIQVNIHSTCGFTALHAAANGSHQTVIKQLLAFKGIDVDVHTKDQNGPYGTSNKNTPLHGAAEMGDPGIAQDLLAAGANPNAVNRIGQTALHSACLDGNTTVGKILVECKATKIDLQDPEGRAAIHIAAEEGHRNIMDLLLGHGADADVVDHMNITALNAACHFGHVAVVRSLLEHGVEKHIKNADGDTALHCAAGQGHTVVVQLLVRHGVDISIRNAEGKTAAQVAGARGHRAVVAALVGLG